MKNFLPLMLVTILFLGSISVQAQTKDNASASSTASFCDKDGKCCANIPDLTDQQKQKIEEFCLTHKKESTQIKNQLNEKQAHLKTLQGADNADMAAINKTIDEITALKSDLMKKCAANKQAIRNLLNDKQKISFDSTPHNCCGNGHSMQKAGCGHGGNKAGCNHGGDKAGCSGKGSGSGCEKKCGH